MQDTKIRDWSVPATSHACEHTDTEGHIDTETHMHTGAEGWSACFGPMCPRGDLPCHLCEDSDTPSPSGRTLQRARTTCTSSSSCFLRCVLVVDISLSLSLSLPHSVVHQARIHLGLPHAHACTCGRNPCFLARLVQGNRMSAQCTQLFHRMNDHLPQDALLGRGISTTKKSSAITTSVLSKASCASWRNTSTCESIHEYSEGNRHRQGGGIPSSEHRLLPSLHCH